MKGEYKIGRISFPVLEKKGMNGKFLQYHLGVSAFRQAGI